MILDVPYQSQEPLETTLERRWCGLASLWMVMAYYLKDRAPSAQELLERYGEEFEKAGFTHQFLLSIARDNNLRGFRKSWWASPGDQTLIDKFKSEGEGELDIKDWQEINLSEGLHTLRTLVNQEYPVIISVNPDFSPSNSTHLIVLVGVEDKDFIVHDPYKKGANYKLSEDEFTKYWIKQAIVIKKD